MIDCPVCGDKIPRNDFEIQHHLINHENEWVNSLRVPVEKFGGN